MPGKNNEPKDGFSVTEKDTKVLTGGGRDGFPIYGEGYVTTRRQKSRTYRIGKGVS